ncbi:alpha/beta hydrolase [Tumidithrix helvetica PCC 7403]
MLLLIISGIVLFLSCWILIPAPIFSLMPLSVGAPEISPLLAGLNAPIALLALWQSTQLFHRNAKKRQPKSPQKLRRYCIALAFSTMGLILSLFPLSQLPSTIQAAESAIAQAIGSNYLAQIPDRRQSQMRSQPFSFLDFLQGIPSPPIRFTAGIQFADPDRIPLTLNIYRPSQTGIYPAIVVVHGGGWQGGSVADHAKFSRYMAAKGYVVWSISYRLAPRYTFPTQLEDVQMALKFIQQHGREYETDLGRIALIGRSAGAHLAMLAAYSPDPPSMPIRAVVNYYGPVDLLAGYYDLPSPDPIDSRTMLKTFLGGTPEQFGDRYRLASPINLANRPMPPSLLIYGGKDRIVMAKFGHEMSRRLQVAGTQAAFLEIPWADHAFDEVFQGLSNQFALYYTERFLAWALR